MDDAQSQLVEKLKSSNSVLVTVSRDPTVDQLSAMLGLTLLLNKQGKHAAAVFSGQIPSTIEFLQPEETIEQNTDSLRDFIIALDKHKADKLRYKVEDNVVRIFITPYKTSISETDLEFSQGDFNIDLILGLGVQQQEDLDEAVMAHGRILHDATVASINTDNTSQLGSINWHDPQASSLSELVTRLAQVLGKDLLDEQISTALLTGIVAETDRFRNEKTSSHAMSASAVLMAAGANQQLVAEKLEEDAKPQEEQGAQSEDGALAIDHEEETDNAPVEGESGIELPAPSEEAVPVEAEAEEELQSEEEHLSSVSSVSQGSKLVTEPPMLGGALTANTQPEGLDPVTDPLSMPQSEPPQLLDHQQLPPTPPPAEDMTPEPEPQPEPQPEVSTPAPEEPELTPPPPAWAPPEPPSAPPAPPAPATKPEPPVAEEGHDNQTLAQIESAVDSPHAEQQKEDLSEARDEVNKAISSAEAAGLTPPQPSPALNALPVDLNPADLPSDPGTPASSPAEPSEGKGSDTPPPVPPPLPFQFSTPPNGEQQNKP